MNPLTHAMLEAIETLILETRTRLHQLEKTTQGIQQRLELETHHLKLLEQKRNALVHKQGDTCEYDISIADYIVKLLHERGTPMRASEIAEALAENGVKTEAENGHISAVLSALSRRTDKFRRVQRGLYCLNCDEVSPPRRSTQRKELAMTAK